VGAGDRSFAGLGGVLSRDKLVARLRESKLVAIDRNASPQKEKAKEEVADVDGKKASEGDKAEGVEPVTLFDDEKKQDKKN